jgi:membrane-bound metal-dependent hydrolase YbcI (DUF457 family)
MPSPIGHALGGIAIAWVAAPRRNWKAAAVLASVALAPDLDLIVGDHRGITHSLGAACVAGAVAWATTRSPRWALAAGLAWASHVGLDWLSNDTRPPIGVMALWPLGRDYYKAAIEIFPPVSRRFGDARFWTHNLTAAIVELAILGPVTLLVLRSLRKKWGTGSGDQ